MENVLRGRGDENAALREAKIVPARIGITDAAYEDAVRKIGLLAYGDREKLPANQIRSMADELADLLRGLAPQQPAISSRG